MTSKLMRNNGNECICQQMTTEGLQDVIYSYREYSECTEQDECEGPTANVILSYSKVKDTEDQDVIPTRLGKEKPNLLSVASCMRVANIVNSKFALKMTLHTDQKDSKDIYNRAELL